LKPLLEKKLDVRSSDNSAKPKIEEISIQKRGDTSYLLVDINYEFPDPVDTYKINYNLFFKDLDPKHQNFVTIHAGTAAVNSVFTENHTMVSDSVPKLTASKVTTEITIPGWMSTFIDYVRLGMEHIWTGYDHLLFIVSLVLLKQSMTSYLKILTAFTIGHSITIALAALDIVRVSADLIEPLIALSIVYVAVENIWAKRLPWRWAFALGFGLIHGFGFAQVLKGSLGEQFILSLFSFNLGVEIGQIAVLAVLLPLLVYSGRIKWYRPAAYTVSGLIAAVGGYWFIERTMF
jgi:hydrogenase/urease accessory protein HupE